MTEFTRFDIPIHRDQHGGLTMKACVVADNQLPLMADIIEKATRPVLLDKEQTIRVEPADMTEDALTHIRQSVARFLQEEMRTHATRAGLAVITEPVLTESIEGGMLAFRCTATAMPLLEKGLGK